VRAYRRAADTLESLPNQVADVLEREGPDALIALPTIGIMIGQAIVETAHTGSLPILERLRGWADPVSLLASVPGVGPALAERIHHRLGIGTLEDLELAVWDGRLATVEGVGPKRLEGARHALAGRLRRPSPPPPPRKDPRPPVAEILDVDREYRRKARSGRLKAITPRRFNPSGQAWLPVLHTTRGSRSYTALYSNTAQAHQVGRTRDWVVLYYDGRGGDGQATVVTERSGSLRGRRVIRGRETECLRHYGKGEPATPPPSRDGDGVI
jgi:DNA polymerase (family X)